MRECSTDPAKLTRFVTAGLDSVTTDRALSSKDLVDLATRLRDLETDHVQFVTVPVEDPNFRRDGISYMVLDQRAAKLVYDALRHDEPLGEEEVPVAAGDDPAAALTVPPGRSRSRCSTGRIRTGSAPALRKNSSRASRSTGKPPTQRRRG